MANHVYQVTNIDIYIFKLVRYSVYSVVFRFWTENVEASLMWPVLSFSLWAWISSGTSWEVQVRGASCRRRQYYISTSTWYLLLLLTTRITPSIRFNQLR